MKGCIKKKELSKKRRVTTGREGQSYLYGLHYVVYAVEVCRIESLVE